MSTTTVQPSPQAEPPDFFISYTGVNKSWAEWIAWCLEEAGHTVVIQAWDFRPGDNWVRLMQEASKSARRTVAVLSDAYLEAKNTMPEWQTAFRLDPTSIERKLIPICVERCTRDLGMLGNVIYIELHGCNEREARRRLLGGIQRGRGKPAAKPPFPGSTDSDPGIH